MSTPLHERVAAAFDALLALAPTQRDAALTAYEASDGPAFRALLLRLLNADATGSDPIAAAVDQAMQGFAAPLARPEQLGPYRLLHELGAGGMGTVFLAERTDGAYAQRVAIKLLRGFPTADGMRRLRQERQILASLDHPCIARLIDGGETPSGQPYLVMEHVDGVSIDRWIEQQSPNRLQRIQLFEHILAAVQHAHQHLIVHRDLKPANILVRNDGMPRLLDFGIAKLVEDNASARDTSTRIMTPAWASPEQQAGKPITTVSDIYCLGLLLREVLLAADARGSAAPLDAELRGVVARATAADPTQRYASAEAFAEDLVRYRNGRPLRAAADTTLYRLRKFLRRNALAALLGALAVIVAGIFVWRLDTERRRALNAETAAASALAQAQRESARAVAVNDFLVSLFRLADPNNNRGEKLDARTLLERGAERIESELKDQPDVRAALQATLAEAMRGLGEYERAAPLIQSAIDATRGSTLDVVRLRAERLSLLASIRSRAGDRRGALEAADHAIAELDTAADEAANLRVGLENTRAMALKWMDRTDDAALALERVLALLPRTGELQTEHRAYALDNLAHVREAQGRWDDAQDTAAQAHAAFVALRGDQHPEPQAVAAYGAALLLMRGKTELALAQYQRVLAVQRELFAANDRRLTNTETGLARTHLRLHDAAAAKPLLDAAVARCKQSFGDHVRCPLSVQALGEWESGYGDATRAITLLREALALREADSESTPRARQFARYALAVALCRHDAHVEGQALLQQALPALLADAHVGPGDKTALTADAATCGAKAAAPPRIRL